MDLGWKERISAETIWLQDRLVLINNSIWYSTRYNYGEKGMVRYNYKIDRQAKIVKYGEYSSITPSDHCCCSHSGIIYIVDGLDKKIVSFDPKKEKFKQTAIIPYLGNNPSCITIHDEIHIIGGRENTKHLIYSISNDNFLATTIEDPTCKLPTHSMCILNYNNRIIKFGGYIQSKQKSIDTFYISSIIKSDDFKNIEWTAKPEYKLKDGIFSCGYVLFKNFIVIFGGDDGSDFHDEIYALDLRKDDGWVELKHIKCPLKSQYRAIVDGDGDVHLYTRINEWPIWEHSEIKHYSMPISHILKDLLLRDLEMLIMGYVRMYIFGKNMNNEKLYDIAINTIISGFVGIGV